MQTPESTQSPGRKYALRERNFTPGTYSAMFGLRGLMNTPSRKRKIQDSSLPENHHQQNPSPSPNPKRFRPKENSSSSSPSPLIPSRTRSATPQVTPTTNSNKKKTFQCETCKKSFSCRGNVSRHIRTSKCQKVDVDLETNDASTATASSSNTYDNENELNMPVLLPIVTSMNSGQIENEVAITLAVAAEPEPEELEVQLQAQSPPLCLSTTIAPGNGNNYNNSSNEPLLQEQLQEFNNAYDNVVEENGPIQIDTIANETWEELFDMIEEFIQGEYFKHGQLTNPSLFDIGVAGMDMDDGQTQEGRENSISAASTEKNQGTGTQVYTTTSPTMINGMDGSNNCNFDGLAQSHKLKVQRESESEPLGNQSDVDPLLDQFQNEMESLRLFPY